MKWPNHADYAEVIQYPEASFEDPTLQKSRPATNALGLPVALSGNFASVYELSTENDTFAVRCFIRQVTNQKTRYAGLSKYFSNLDLPFMVPFEFVSHGIRVNEDWYPIVKMDWVHGDPLHSHVEKNLDQSGKIELLSIEWRELVRTLEENHVGHGDLQHGNVLVAQGGQIKLVDYDGMFVPVFANEKSPELGHPNYQHPLRNPDFYDERLDHFSALLIYLSLKAVSAEPQLWKDFHTGDNLIVSASDMRVPQSSPLWPRLLDSPDEEVQKLTVFFTDFLKVQPMNVPDLETILESSIRGIVVPKNLDMAQTGNLGPLEEAPPAPPGGSLVEEAPAPSLPVKAFEIAGWSAIIFALLALAPPFRVIGGTGALLLAFISFLLPGKHLHYNRALAIVAVAIGLARITHDPHLEAAARITPTKPVSTLASPIAVASIDSSGTLPQADAPKGSQLAIPSSDFGSQTNPPDLLTELQSISLPLLEPADQPIVKPIVTWNAHRQSVSSIAFTGDGQHIITTSPDQTLSIWNALDQTQVHSISNLASPVVSITTLTNAGIFATANRSANLEWWSIDGGIPLKQIRFNENSLFPPTISHDGHLISIGGQDRRSIALHRDGSPQIADVISGFSSWVKQVHFSDDSKRIIVVGYDDSISLREVDSGKILRTITYPDSDVQEVVCSSDGKWLVAIGSTGGTRAWNTQTGELTANARLQTSGIAHARFSNDNVWIIVATGLGEIHCVFARNGLVRSPNVTERSPFTSTALSPDGRWLATGDNLGQVSVWKSSDLLNDSVLQMARP